MTKSILTALALMFGYQASAAETVISCDQGDAKLVEVERFSRFGQLTIIRNLEINNAAIIDYFVEAGAVSDYYAGRDRVLIPMNRAFDNGEYAGYVAIQSQVSYSHVFAKPRGDKLQVELWKANSSATSSHHTGTLLADWTFSNCK